MSNPFRVSKAEQKALVQRMLNEGMSKNQIKEKLGISWYTLYKIMDELGEKKDEKKTEQPAPEQEELEVPPSTDQDIINSASEMSAKKSAQTLSEMIHKDYIGSINAAKILKEAEMRYRKTLETWGWKWESFVQQALDEGFKKAEGLQKLEALLELMKEE